MYLYLKIFTKEIGIFVWVVIKHIWCPLGADSEVIWSLYVSIIW